MGRWGFTPRNEERTMFSNGKFVVSDLQKGNIVRDADGNVRVIDADVKLHTKDMGGDYSYPPVEMDTEVPELMTVYHGSGAQFDKFDHSHMGEGEGNQAYGWGSYVTEVEGIGKRYAEITASMLYKGRKREDFSVQSMSDLAVIHMLSKIKDGYIFSEAKSSELKWAKRDLESYKKQPITPDVEKEISETNQLIEALESLDEKDFSISPRHIYTVEIPDNNGENYLEWDKPLTKNQIDVINKGLVHLMDNPIFPEGLKKVWLRQYNGHEPVINIFDKDEGYRVYGNLTRDLTDKYTSKFLNSLGYVGIKYPAGRLSGGHPDGTSNYVIFNENDLVIKDRVDFLRDGKTVYGMTLGDKILINEDRLNPNTPVHEYTHIWDRAVRRTNPELWSRGVELMKQTSLWKTVSEDANYADLDENGIASEVHSRLVGEKGEETLNAMSKEVLEGNGGIFDTAAKMSVIEKLRSWLKEFWYWVKNTMTPWSREEASMVGLNEFVNMPMADLARETRIGEDEVRFSVGDIAKMETPILKSKGTFKNLKEAEQWAKENLQGKEYRNKYTQSVVSISGKSIKEMLAEKFAKTVSVDAHMAALQSVPDFIKTGIPAEIHSDTHGRGYDVMRLYNAIEIGKDTYRVKSTIKKLNIGERYYTYEIEEMEVIDGTQSPAVGLDGTDNSRPQTYNSISNELIEGSENTVGLPRGTYLIPKSSSINSISGAKLLKGVKKTNSTEYILPKIDGLPSYTSDEVKQTVRDYIEDTLAESGFDARVLDLELIGSRMRGNSREDSDLDAVVEYEGTEREDDMFNLLHDEDFPLEIDGVRVDINPIRKEETGTLDDYMERSAEYDRDVLSNMYSEEEGLRFRVVDDKATLDRLNSEPTIKVYRAMQLHDGALYPPMAGKVNGKWQDGIAVEDLGTVWEQSEEHPELVDNKGYFKLDKGNGKSLRARYNPYFHTSTTPLNDQFSSAQDRPELVTVEVEVPESELTSGYKAKKAKDAVGRVEWKAGVIQGKLSGTRTVILSRWDRPMRIVPDSEVADVIVDMFQGKGITMPSNVVTPSLRSELEKRGVPFVETDNKGRRIDDVRFDVSEGYTAEEQSIIDRAKADGTYMKAPNGKDSNLKERQWAQVRTKAFKAWFGDWELSDKWTSILKLDAETISSDAISEEEAEKMYRQIGFATNFQDNKRVEFVNKAFGKIVRHKGVDTKLLMPKMSHLFENAIPCFFELEQSRDGHKDHSSNFVGYHNYLNKISIDGVEYYVRFTVQEIRTNPNRQKSEGFIPYQFHSSSISDVEIYKKTDGSVESPSTSLATGTIGNYFDTKLGTFLKKANKAYENASKVVDENGEPKVVYHGTIEDRFTVFNKKYADDLRSFFFTDSRRIAGGYADEGEFDEDASGIGEVYDLYLNMRNPLVVEGNGSEWFEQRIGVRWSLKDTDREVFKKILDRMNERGVDLDYINAPNDVRYEFDYEYAKWALDNIFTDEEKDELEIENDIYLKDICKYLVPSLDLDSNCHIVTNTRTINELAEKAGYDGVIFKDIIDSAKRDTMEPSTVYALFDANRIKSAVDNTGDFSVDSDDIRFQVSDFRNGLASSDDVFDAMAEALEWNYVVTSDLMDSLEKYYKGTIRSASYLAGYAMKRDNMLPFPGGKYAGKDEEYHHIMFEDANGETFVEAVPFEDADKVESWMEKGELDEARFDVSDEKAVNSTFNKSLDRYIKGKMKSNEYFTLGVPMGVMEYFLPNVPIVMRQRIIKKGSVKKHNVDPASLKNMPKYLSNPIFVFKRSDDALGVLIEMHDREGKNVCVAIELNRQMQEGKRILEVNDIRSIHGREVMEIINPIVNNGSLVWVDKEKGLEYLSSASQYVQQEINRQDLSSATKLVETFENPKVPEDNGVRFDVSDIRIVNDSFNRELESLTAENANDKILYLGKPSDILLSVGIRNNPLKLYGNKIIKKMTKHGFVLSDIKNLPMAVADPIAIFRGAHEDSYAVLTELKFKNNNFLVTLSVGKGNDVDFNIISSVYDKANEGVVAWIEKGKGLYYNKEKMLDYLRISAPIAEAQSNHASSSSTKLVETFENPKVPEDVSYRVAPEYEDRQSLNNIYTNGLPSSMDKVLLDIDDELSEDTRWAIAKVAADNGFDFVKATADYLAGADIEEVKPQLERVREMMREDIGDEQPISLKDVQWVLYQSAHRGTDSLFGMISRMSKAEALGHTPQDNELLDKVDDGTRFSISEEMEAHSATDMYNRASGYWRNRIKEGLVDMNESVNDLVNAIEKQSGLKADSFEDIRPALNQQSSRGLHDMNRYTSVYLEPMWDAIKSVMKATDLSYDDVSRYVILKHALERNVVFARRDARNSYKDEYAKLISGVELNKKEVENRRKQAIIDRDKEEMAKCDAELVTLDNEIARLQSELQTHLEEVEKGTDKKFKDNRKNDYSGLTSMFSEYPGLLSRENYASEVEYQQAARRTRKPIYDKVADMEKAAEAEVRAVEAKAPQAVTELWTKINAATKATLTSQYRSNMLTKEQYESVRDQFQYYVPLRGFTDVTAEDVWDYYNDSKSGSFAPILVSAKGRTSQAENPFIWIGTMASTAIVQNLKNRTKLSLYYFVANRADKQDLVTVRDVWYKYDEDVTAEYQAQHPGSMKRIFTPVYPPVFTESLDSESAKAAYDLWEESMKREAEKGNAYRGTQRMDVEGQVAFVSAKEKPQHIITMKVRGREMALIINGNPRAAQAINGALNIETSAGYQKVFGPVLRFMSAVNTSYNPEFWISNAQRDILYAWMSTMVQGKSGKKFFKNLVSPKELMRMARAYKEGTLGNSKLERYYQEFAEGGGITGFTVISGNEVWEKKIQSFLEPKFFDKMKNGKFLAFFQDLGESIEQMSRFSAYITARDEGKSIADAVSDSKEITVNFNRKGSGKNISIDEVKKLTKKNGSALTKAEQAGVLILSQIAPAGRSLYMFFNAGVQGCNNLLRLAKRNPKYFGVAVGAFFALGALQALIHAMIDDDDDYLDMPENMRKDNILLGAGGVYLKWAMPQEMRSFYALGDIYINKLEGRSPDTNVIWDTFRTLSEPLPINLNEGVAGLMPSYVRPLFELVTNKDYSGRSIYNGLPYMTEEERSRTPRYKQAYGDTSRLFVDMSHLMNVLTGGDEYTAGAVNVIPESMQHLVESYGGGLLTTLNKTADFASGLLGLIPGIDAGVDLTVRRIPFLNRVLVVSDDNIRNSYANRLYYYYKGEAEHTKKILKQSQKDRNRDAYRDIVHSKDFEIYKVYEKYRKAVEEYQDSIKEEDDRHERKLLMRQQDEIKKQMIRDISNL